MEMDKEPQVQFAAGRVVAVAGMIAGVAIAVGVPAVVLGLQGQLTAHMQLWLVVMAVALGGLTSVTATFFGLAIPSSVEGKWDSPCETRKNANSTAKAAE